jgi:heat shock protein HslJ
MKYDAKPAVLLAAGLGFFLFAACASQGPAADPAAAPKPARQIDVRGFSDLQGLVWKLVELRAGSGHIVFDRDKLRAEESDDIFTIQFDGTMVSGEGAPNKYRGPYQQGEAQKLSFGNIAATLMASIREPEKLQERVYFDLLGRVNRWAYAQGRLELYSTDENGQETVLAYIPE